MDVGPSAPPMMPMDAASPSENPPNATHRKYPYLLRGVKVTHVNQVRSTDITYIRLKHGFVYLTAIIDWYSRRILASRLSNLLRWMARAARRNSSLDNHTLGDIF